MAKIGIIGIEGRMGQAIAKVLATSKHGLVGGVGRGEQAFELAAQSDVLVDFSAPQAIENNLRAARGENIPILIGTTGLSEMELGEIADAAQDIPVLQTGNTSLGVNLLAHLVGQAAAKLGPEWDIEILEMHHRMKVDAPSGTALLLGEAAAAARGIDLAGHSESGRDGHAGARQDGAIGFAALRGGTVAGDHSVIFAGSQERITLSHNAEDRSIFARGAVQGATWLIGKPAGRYSMKDVLGLD